MINPATNKKTTTENTSFRQDYAGHVENTEKVFNIKFMLFIIIVIIFLCLTSCNRKSSLESTIMVVDSLGWNEDEGTLVTGTSMVRVGDFLAVSDFHTSEILLFDANDFSFVKCISQKGLGPNETSIPFCLARKGNNIIVSDLMNGRIKEIDLDGNLITNYPGIRTYLVAYCDDEIVFQPTDSSLDLPMLKVIREGEVENYFMPDRIFDKYLKTENGKIPLYRFFMNEDKLIFSFMNDDGTILCVDKTSGEIDIWDSIIQAQSEMIMSISFYEDYFYFLKVKPNPKDFNIMDEQPQLLKVNTEGEIINRAYITSDYKPNELFYITDDQLFLFDTDNANIKVFSLKGF